MDEERLHMESLWRDVLFAIKRVVRKQTGVLFCGQKDEEQIPINLDYDDCIANFDMISNCRIQ